MTPWELSAVADGCCNRERGKEGTWSRCCVASAQVELDRDGERQEGHWCYGPSRSERRPTNSSDGVVSTYRYTEQRRHPMGHFHVCSCQWPVGIWGIHFVQGNPTELSTCVQYRCSAAHAAGGGSCVVTGSRVAWHKVAHVLLSVVGICATQQSVCTRVSHCRQNRRCVVYSFKCEHFRASTPSIVCLDYVVEVSTGGHAAAAWQLIKVHQSILFHRR